MEELLAQLLAQAALEQKAHSDEKHGALLTQLARQKVAVGGAQGTVTRKVLGYDMPVLQRADPLARDQQANDIAANVERGIPVPSHLYQGLNPADIVGGLGYGAGNYFLDRQIGPEAVPTPYASQLKAPSVQFPVYTGGGPAAEDYADETRKMNARMKAGRLVNDEVRREGHFNPALLDGLTHAEAARRIADQLMAERERRGDPMAWWNTFAGPTL